MEKDEEKLLILLFTLVPLQYMYTAANRKNFLLAA